MGNKRSLSRRAFLRASAVGVVGVLGLDVLAACSAPAAPNPTATKAAPSVAPTTAPASGGVPAAATSTPEKMGSSLVGKLEGPEYILDPAKFPKQFAEAPMLDAMVKAGQLPPIEQRLPTDMLVVKPLHEVGKYGGELRRGFTGPADQWNARRIAGADTMLWYDYTGNNIVPNVAKEAKTADDGKSLTLTLRQGLKWSDGQPFTADDIIFWHEDVYTNKELLPSQFTELTMDDGPVTVEKIDDYTVKFNFPAPYSFFYNLLASGENGVGGQALRGLEAAGGYMPAHYIKQYLPQYAGGEAALAEKAKAEGFDNWVKLFKFKNDWSSNPDLPVLTAWKTVSPINTPQWVMERNPYYWMVDNEGNQLPYMDKLVLTLAENLEVLNLRAIAGEFDLQERHMDLGKLPVLLDNQEKGDYKVYLDPGAYGADAALHFNLAYDADAELHKWINTVDFRRALSLGVDRDQLNEAFWLGTGIPGSVIPADGTTYNPGEAKYRTLWHTKDVKQANEMLDKIGLTKKDAEGYRLRSDGKGRLTIEVQTYGGQFLQFTQIAEMIRQQWKEIGIDLFVKEVERSLGITRISNNEHQIFMWTNDDSVPELVFSGKVIPTEAGGWSFHGNPYAKWFQTRGQQGTKPEDPRLLEALEKFRNAFFVGEQERVQLCKDVWAISVEEVFSIGTVSVSPASQGVRVVKNKIGNVPGRIVNNVSQRHPLLGMPATFYWKS